MKFIEKLFSFFTRKDRTDQLLDLLKVYAVANKKNLEAYEEAVKKEIRQKEIANCKCAVCACKKDKNGTK